MKNLILFDDDGWKSLLPISYTRPAAEIRVGILTIKEKWETYLDAKASYITQDYLSEKYPIQIEEDNWVVNGRLLPNPKIIRLIQQLDQNEALLYHDQLMAARMNRAQFERLTSEDAIDELAGVDLSKDDDLIEMIRKPYDIFGKNGEELKKDFKLLTAGRSSQTIDHTNHVTNPENIFIEEGAQVKHAYLDATDFPIYVAKGAKIMQGSMITGGLALCEHSTIKMGAKLYGPSTVGPHSKVGGEMGNSVILGYSNKGHDGYLGNSVLGEWCNLGADTNNSNLKNNYAEVKLWDYEKEGFQKTGLQFCGLIMGDHSKTGINTMFNTGTVVGVSCNIYGPGFPRNFIPSFSWGGAQGFTTYSLNKANDTASRVMMRRKKDFDEIEKIILEHIFHSSSYHRVWEKA